jgi:hypothetical protein
MWSSYQQVRELGDYMKTARLARPARVPPYAFGSSLSAAELMQ